MTSINPHLRFNPCAKCSGTIAMYEDHDGPYTMCLRCGATRDLAPSGQEVQAVLGRIRELSGPGFDPVGCEVSPSCLSCPLPACKHEAYQGNRWHGDRERIQVMVQENITNVQAADRFGTSPRGIARTWSRDAERNRQLHPKISNPTFSAEHLRPGS